MDKPNKQETKKEKVLQMLASLTPKARIAVLSAALELKQEQKTQAKQGK